MKVQISRGVWGNYLAKNRIFLVSALQTSSGSLIARVLAVASALYAAKSLHPAGYGEFTFLLSTAGLASGVGLLGLASIITKEISGKTEELSAFAASSFLVAWCVTLLAGVTVCLTIYALDVMPLEASFLSWSAIVASWSLGLTSNTVLVALLTGRRKFSVAARLTVARSFAVAVAMLVGAFRGSPLETSLFVCIAEGLVFIAAFGRIYAVRTVDRGIDGAVVRSGMVLLLRVGVRAGPAAIAVQAALWGLQAVLVAAPNGSAMLGALALGQRIVLVVTLIPTAFNSASLALLSMRGLGSPSLRTAVGAPLLVAGVATGAAVIAALLGLPTWFEQYVPYLPSILVLICSAIPQALNGAIGSVAVAKGLISQWVASDIVLAGILFALGWAALGAVGLVGVSLAYVAAYGVSALFLIRAVYLAGQEGVASGR